MASFKPEDKIYTSGLTGMTKCGWDPTTLAAGKITKLVFDPSTCKSLKLDVTQNGFCCAMACYWARESFQGDSVGKAVNWPESKIAIAQGHYVRLFGSGSDENKPLKMSQRQIMDDLVKIFDLKIELDYKNKKLGNVMNDLEKARSGTFLIGLNGKYKHVMAVRNRQTDFLYFCPLWGCMKRAIEDYRECITDFCKGAWFMTDDDTPTVYEVVVA